MSVHAETAIEIWDEEKLIALLLFLLSFLFSVSEEEEEEEEEEGERGVKVMEPVTFGSRSSSSSSRFIVSLRVTSLFLVLLFRVLEFFFSQRRNSMNYFFFHFLANRAEMLVVSFK
tara:strand:- start:87 stop:434 length:348 start_codon:yes stop_codon:yes gene_type:complete